MTIQDKVKRVVSKTDLVVDYEQIGNSFFLEFDEAHVDYWSKKLFATLYQKSYYNVHLTSVSRKSQTDIIKEVERVFEENYRHCVEVYRFKKRIKRLEREGYDITGRPLVHGQAQIMENGRQVGYVNNYMDTHFYN